MCCWSRHWDVKECWQELLCCPLLPMFASTDSKSLLHAWWSFKNPVLCKFLFRLSHTQIEREREREGAGGMKWQGASAPWWTDGREIYGFMTHPLLINAREALCPWKIAAWPLFQLSAFMQQPWLPFKHTMPQQYTDSDLSLQKSSEGDTHLRQERERERLQ